MIPIALVTLKNVNTIILHNIIYNVYYKLSKISLLVLCDSGNFFTLLSFIYKGYYISVVAINYWNHNLISTLKHKYLTHYITYKVLILAREMLHNCSKELFAAS